MSNSPVESRFAEPAHVGPIAGGNLRASDADRDKVTTVLTTAYAEGRITREEHDERLELVLAAKTFDELIPITSDLVLAPAPTTYTATPPAPVADAGFAIDTAHAHDDPETMVGIFGGATRKGKWRIRKQTNAYALFGGIDLDLREATFEAPSSRSTAPGASAGWTSRFLRASRSATRPSASSAAPTSATSATPGPARRCWSSRASASSVASPSRGPSRTRRSAGTKAQLPLSLVAAGLRGERHWPFDRLRARLDWRAQGTGASASEGVGAGAS